MNTLLSISLLILATIDVNVSPDKRTVFFQHEKELFAKFRASLIATFGQVSGMCPRSAVKSTSANQLSEGATLFPQTQMSDDDMFDAGNDSHLDLPSSSMPHTAG